MQSTLCDSNIYLTYLPTVRSIKLSACFGCRAYIQRFVKTLSHLYVHVHVNLEVIREKNQRKLNRLKRLHTSGSSFIILKSSISRAIWCTRKQHIRFIQSLFYNNGLLLLCHEHVLVSTNALWVVETWRWWGNKLHVNSLIDNPWSSFFFLFQRISDVFFLHKICLRYFLTYKLFRCVS